MRAIEPDRAPVAEILRRAGAPAGSEARLEDLKAGPIVVKYGGAAMVSPEAAASFADDLVLLHDAGARPLVVHGGGSALTETMDRLGLESTFVEGHRVTNAEAAEIAEMVLSGRINKKVVSLLQRAGAKAVGLSGTDGGFVAVERHRPNGTDLGFVGRVEAVDAALPTLLLDAGYIPVISSTAADRDGLPHNINADVMTGAVAAAMGASRVVFLTDVPGVMIDGEPRRSLSAGETADLIRAGVAAGGMRPKLEAALVALAAGVPEVRLVDGRSEHALLRGLFAAEGPGTVVVADGSRS